MLYDRASGGRELDGFPLYPMRWELATILEPMMDGIRSANTAKAPNTNESIPFMAALEASCLAVCSLGSRSNAAELSRSPKMKQLLLIARKADDCMLSAITLEIALSMQSCRSWS
jgi:hypothetical protein